MVYNAGYGVFNPLVTVSEAQFDGLFNVHLKGPFFLTQALLPLLAENASIVNLTSATTRVATAGVAPYAAFKGGLEVLTRYMAKEFGERGIRAHAVSPGAIRAELGGGLNDEFEAMLAAQTALGRVGEPAICPHTARRNPHRGRKTDIAQRPGSRPTLVPDAQRGSGSCRRGSPITQLRGNPLPVIHLLPQVAAKLGKRCAHRSRAAAFRQHGGLRANADTWPSAVPALPPPLRCTVFTGPRSVHRQEGGRGRSRAACKRFHPLRHLTCGIALPRLHP
ncbi:Short-chain dehydrogenase/reductase SDR [Pseudomonas amygdali pv. morsprunorum str. M302280]|nr:Short-chain dehydrogenase/reductase SDR [Pseudomonas amygdali pv. morsprunorum str. M302280]